jgi:hypothetical protein
MPGSVASGTPYMSRNGFKRASGYLTTIFNQQSVFKKLITTFSWDEGDVLFRQL